MPNTPDSAEDLAARIDELTRQAEQLDANGAALANALKDAVEAFHKVGLQELLTEVTKSQRGSSALREASALPSVYAMFRRHGLIKPSLQEQVLEALELVKPELKQHGGDVRLVAIPSHDTVEIQLLGACDGCGSSEITLKQGIEKNLRERCTWIEHIVTAPGQNASSTATDSVRVLSPFEAKLKQALQESA